MRAALLPFAVPLLVAPALCGQTSIPSVAIEVGEPFPNLVLPSLADGQPYSIARFRGKKIVLHIFASW
ncbi:MAG: TlpA family protein disulfide reductase [Planctomycetota bacterium]